jgi:hypothetical protein
MLPDDTTKSPLSEINSFESLRWLSLSRITTVPKLEFRAHHGGCRVFYSASQGRLDPACLVLAVFALKS